MCFMKLVEFRVQNYKCVNDTGWIEIDDITCFIGKNQSGKTAILEALNKLNPLFNNSNYEPYEEYPRSKYTSYEQRHDENPDIVISGKFEISDEEVSSIESKYGENILTNTNITVHKNYKNNLRWDIQIDEEKYIETLLDGYSLHNQTEKKLQKSNNITELVENIADSDSEEDQEQFENILTEINDGELSLAEEIGNDILKDEIPQFLYMGEYHFLDDEISMEKLLHREKEDKLKKGDEVFMSLLSIANLEANELKQEKHWKKIRTRLEASAANVTDYVLEYWSQNDNIEIQFDRNYVPSSKLYNFSEEMVVEVLVRNLEHRATVPFGQQSRGFRWFFSVFCHFTDLKNKENLIVLLDEPGLHLHARAQQDFLDFLNDELSTDHMVLYSTHSPFMIDPRNLHQAKMVRSNPDRGTNVSTDVMKTDAETRVPLQNVFEFDLIDTLLIRPQTLLVEGKSDHSYIYTMSEVLGEKGRTELDRRWTVIPVGSGSNVPTFVSLFGGNDLDIAVLIDGDGKAEQRKSEIESKGVIKSNNIKTITDFINQDYGDIEDLFSTDLYFKIVNRAFAAEIHDSHVQGEFDESDLKDDNKNPRIVKRLEKFFDRQYINEGVLEHHRPAKYIEENREYIRKEIDDETIDNFETLFKEFNKLLEEM